MDKAKRIGCLAIFIFVLPTFVWASMPIPATEETQLLNFGGICEIISEAKTQVTRLTRIANQNIQMIDDFKRQAMLAPDLIWSDTSAAISEILNIKRKAEGLVYSISNFDDEFKNKFKGYKNWIKTQKNMDFSKQYQTWSNSYQKSAKNCLMQSNAKFEIEDDARQTLAKLKETFYKAGGRNEILQTTTMMEKHSMEQMDQLKEIVAAQAHMQATYQLNEKDREDAAQAFKDTFYSQSNNRPIIGNGVPFP